uniref:OPA3-like protein CG13603 n=1 Tax=Strongyloides papillosus TaxID=174720 RepID=A0A0N5B3L0_STREA
MGIPLAQFALVAIRQMSKPIAERIIKYGKSHPAFRDRVLVPCGRYMIKTTQRLRFKVLGLKQTEEPLPISEKEALEQASEVIQQIVMFLYSIAAISAYSIYTSYNSSKSSPQYVEESKLEELVEKLHQENSTLSKQIESIEKRLLFLGDNTRLYNKKMWDKICQEEKEKNKVTSIEKEKKSEDEE